MSKPLRIDVADGWYHVMARGLERRVVFSEPREHAHFLERLAVMVARYGVTLHAYVLLANHYQLLVQTPHANLSRARCIGWSRRVTDHPPTLPDGLCPRWLTMPPVTMATRSRSGGVSELRIDYDPGCRVYFTKGTSAVVILLAGGDKRRQTGDIRTAVRLAQNL